MFATNNFVIQVSCSINRPARGQNAKEIKDERAMSKNMSKPTESELEILQVLWEHGPSTVRFVNEKLNEKKETGYTTTLKIMQIMTTKGMLVRDEDGRTHIYKPAAKEEDT